MIRQEVLDLMERLDALDEDARMELLSQADEQRAELLGILLEHLAASDSTSVRVAAVYLIGRHRLKGGARELVRRIDLAAPRQPKYSPRPLWGRYPAMEALINIGLPGVPAVVELLSTDADDLRRDLAVKVVRYLGDAGLGRFILQTAREGESVPERRAMLDDALARLERLIRQTA